MFGLRHSTTVLIATILMIAEPAYPQEEEEWIGDVSDGSRAIPVHLINLYDEDGAIIMPDDDPIMPLSIRETCGRDCHDYVKVSSGWHFNAADPQVPPGRRSEPWILVDQRSATVVPLSYRPWPGTFRPDEVDLSSWRFLQRFGRHTPGGGIGEDEDAQSPEYFMRWMVSGNLEVNCLSCHDAEPAHDQAEYATQIARQNFRWAAAASSGFAWVTGAAKDMPDTWDPYLGGIPDRPGLVPPSVSYDKSRFNPEGKVFFNIVRKIPAERCYFCHSNKTLGEIGSDSPEKWEIDEDVHLSAGMTCVDCHRNGLDHAMVRGYEGEELAQKNPYAATLSCQGCHLPSDSFQRPVSGRLGAPEPEHRGIPPIHFETVTCTGCHTGPWPTQGIQRVKTSRVHALGVIGVNKSDDLLPHIIYPVFVKQEDGRIAPHKLFWPSFWGTLEGDTVRPIEPDRVWSAGGKIIVGDLPLSAEALPSLSDEQIVDVLGRLGSRRSIEGLPVYITGGKLYRLGEANQLVPADHPSAQPYSWAYAHDVGPAVQSLGVRGCEDCHATDAPFFFGDVVVHTTAEKAVRDAIRMYNMQGEAGPEHVRIRRFFKWFIIVVLALLGLHILGDLVSGVWQRQRRTER